MRCCSRTYEMSLLRKKISMTKKILILQSSFTCTWMYAMPHLHKQLILHNLHIYKLNMKHVSISLSKITYTIHTIMVYVQWLVWGPKMYKMFLLEKNISLLKEMLTVKLNFTWMYLMPIYTSIQNVHVTGHVHVSEYGPTLRASIIRATNVRIPQQDTS
jgi:hypothetical protein